MIATIQFYRKHSIIAHEINDKIMDDMLSTKMQS